MDIYISSEIGVCQEYMSGKGKKKETVSVVISPLKVQEDNMNLKVINGCNMWQSCHNEKCFFSAAARTNPIIKANK